MVSYKVVVETALSPYGTFIVCTNRLLQNSVGSTIVHEHAHKLNSGMRAQRSK